MKTFVLTSVSEKITYLLEEAKHVYSLALFKGRQWTYAMFNLFQNDVSFHFVTSINDIHGVIRIFYTTLLNTIDFSK